MLDIFPYPYMGCRTCAGTVYYDTACQHPGTYLGLHVDSFHHQCVDVCRCPRHHFRSLKTLPRLGALACEPASTIPKHLY